MSLSSSARALHRLYRMTAEAKPEVLFSFGAIADVQCGELDDRLHVKPYRYYRNALHCLRGAISTWNHRTVAPAFVLQLGDVLDGFNILRGGKEQAARVLQDVVEACEVFRGDFHHVWGNHELYNFTRLELLNSPLFSGRRFLRDVHPDVYRGVAYELKSKIHLPNKVLTPLDNNTINGEIERDTELLFANDRVPVYYDFSPCKGYRFVLLDTFDVSTLGYAKDSQEVANALSIIRTHNKNEDVRVYKGLPGLEKRFVSFNGGISKRQLDWLKRVLDRAKSLHERVIVFGHVPVYPEVTLDFCLVWNYMEVLEVLRSSGCVVATLSGHTHWFRHQKDMAGINHIVLPGIVECRPGTNAFVTFDVGKDFMTMHGEGEVPTLMFNFPKI